MKRNKLYTVNKWNQPAFMEDRKNLFAEAGQMDNSMAAWDRAASKAYGASYGDAGSTLNDYMNSTNWLGISKADNPFSKGNLMSAFSKGGLGSSLGSIGGGAISGIGSMVGGAIGSAIGGGYESGVGNALGSLGKVASVIPGPWGAAISGGLQVLGGGVNALWGTKVDEAKLKANQEGTNTLLNFASNASSLDDVKGITASSNVQDAYSGGVFKKDWAERKNAQIRKFRNDALAFADRSVGNNIFNLTDDQMNNALANYSAYGGPVDTVDNNMGAIDYDFMDRYMTAKERQNELKNKVSNIPSMPAFMQNGFAFGGDLQTNGADFPTKLTHINAGGSHSENPNDGVQLGVDPEGTPNLVEENETVFNNYVYSNRIFADGGTLQKFHLPKKAKLTFAEISKKLEKEIKERPNDPISEAGFKAQMEQLADEQERQKQEMEAERAKAAFEALSPEEQTALMQQRAQQEAITQQAAQEQAMAEQQAAMQQATPEEIAMAQQAQMQADGTQAMVGQQAPMMAYGGKVNRFDTGGGIVVGSDGLIDYDKTLIELPEIIVKGKKKRQLPTITATKSEIINGLNAIQHQQALEEIAQAIQERNQLENEYGRTKIHYYDKGGDLKKKVYNLLHINTDSEFKDWIEKNGEGKLDYKIINDLLDKNDYKTLSSNADFWKLAAKDSPALSHAIESGYDFGAYAPNGETKSGYLWEDLWPAINETSRLKGNRRDKYQIDHLYNKKEVQGIEAKPEYKAFTDYILNNATDEERKKYFKWIDDNTGRDRAYTDEKGNLLDGWQDKYRDARNDGLWGIQHYTPEMEEFQRGAIARNFVQMPNGEWEEVKSDIPTDWTSAGSYTWNDPKNAYTHNYYTKPAAATPEDDVIEEEKPVDETDNIKDKPIIRDERLRYAGLFGPAVGLGMMAAGVGKPDVLGIDAAVNAANGPITEANYQPIGNYITYRPMDIWYQQNALNAQSRATDRALLNSSSPSRTAGLLANGYNSQLASGNLYRQVLEYNDALEKQVADFNRGTDMFNAEAYNRNSQFNADARNRARQYGAQIALQGAAQKMDADAGWYNSLYGNIAGLFKGVGDIGRENAQWNMISRGAADGVFGVMGDSYTGRTAVKRSKSEGDKVKKKKGLTF